MMAGFMAGDDVLFATTGGSAPLLITTDSSGVSRTLPLPPYLSALVEQSRIARSKVEDTRIGHSCVNPPAAVSLPVPCTLSTASLDSAISPSVPQPSLLSSAPVICPPTLPSTRPEATPSIVSDGVAQAAHKAKLVAPRKPLSPYMLFMRDRRDQLVHERPQASFLEISRELGQIWRQLLPEQKAIYSERWEREKERYAGEVRALQESSVLRNHDWREGTVPAMSLAAKGGARAHGSNASDRIRRPVNAYVIFSQRNRAAVAAQRPDASFTEIGKLLGSAWSLLSPEEKQVYEVESERDKSRYLQELTTLGHTASSRKRPHLIGIVNRNKRRRQAGDSGPSDAAAAL